MGACCVQRETMAQAHGDSARGIDERTAAVSKADMTPRQLKILNDKVNESVGLEFPVDTDGAINEDEEYKKDEQIAFSHGTIEVSDTTSGKEEDVQPESEDMPFGISKYEHSSP